jgi:hypothetical protein
MTIVAAPDILGAVNARLRSFSEITALVGTSPRPRVSAVLQKDWVMPTFAILLRPVGGPAPDYWVQIQQTRIDVRCYGPKPHEAMKLWRTVHACLCQPAVSGRVSFRLAHCIVYNVTQEAGPISIIEPETKWPFTTAPYVFMWSEVPLA